MMIIETGSETQLNIEGSFVYSTLISMVAALGSVMFGFDIAIISGAAPFVQIHFGLNELQLGWGVSSLLIGCMIGTLVAGRLADRFGRKRTLICIALIFAFTSVMTATAPAFYLFVIARILGGLAVGSASMVSPLYIAEASPYAIRGRMVALNQLGITFGILASYLINYMLRDLGPNNWRWMFATGALPSVAFFVLLFLVPESPRWLFLSGRFAEAQAILVRIGGTESAQHELFTMHKPDDRAAARPKELLQPKNRRVLLIGILLAVLCQTTGINTIIDYAPIILKSAGSSLSSAMFQTFVIGVVNFVCTFVAVLFVDKLGRRLLYIWGSCGMTLALILITMGFVTGKTSGVLGLASILLFIASFAACIGPVYWILMAEMFPNRIRGLAMSIAVFATWFSNFFVVLLFPWLLKNLGGGFTFGMIAVMAVGMIFVAWKLVPETSGKTLEEIEDYWAAFAK
jgi:SP family arabinose:H+ symporter-like MFS transporter